MSLPKGAGCEKPTSLGLEFVCPPSVWSDFRPIVLASTVVFPVFAIRLVSLIVPLRTSFIRSRASPRPSSGQLGNICLCTLQILGFRLCRIHLTTVNGWHGQDTKTDCVPRRIIKPVVAPMSARLTGNSCRTWASDFVGSQIIHPIELCYPRFCFWRIKNVSWCVSVTAPMNLPDRQSAEGSSPHSATRHCPTKLHVLWQDIDL